MKERLNMKKILLLGLAIFCLSCAVQAGEHSNQNCECPNMENKTKCLDLATSMYNERFTMYNVLNLSSDQAKIKDQLDKERYQALDVVFNQLMQERYVLKKLCENNASESAIKKQQKIIKDCEKCMRETADKYDKEFLDILTVAQKAKFKSIRKMARKEMKYCRNNKAFYERDPQIRPFGQKMYYTDTETRLCPTHKKWHLFGRKHIEENQEQQEQVQE